MISVYEFEKPKQRGRAKEAFSFCHKKSPRPGNSRGGGTQALLSLEPTVEPFADVTFMVFICIASLDSVKKTATMNIAKEDIGVSV